MLAVIALCKDIIARHAIYPTRVLGHSDIAPMRKIDPGEKFDWARLHAEGIGHWVKPEPIGGGTFLQLGDQGQAVEALQGMLRLYGYATEISGKYDGLTQATVRAFQRHFRPSRVDGIADSSTVITLHRLLNALDQA
jgi:N-acetylmuramoyl-L-alanine amidase